MYLYVASGSREHRVWVDGKARFSVERCNLDDAHLTKASEFRGNLPRCKWCQPEESPPRE